MLDDIRLRTRAILVRSMDCFGGSQTKSLEGEGKYAPSCYLDGFGNRGLLRRLLFFCLLRAYLCDKAHGDVIKSSTFLGPCPRRTTPFEYYNDYIRCVSVCVNFNLHDFPNHIAYL